MSARSFLLPVIIISFFIISNVPEMAEAASQRCLFDGPSISATNVPYGGSVTVLGRVTGGTQCFATGCWIYKNGVNVNVCRTRFNQSSPGDPSGGTYGPLYTTTTFLVEGEGMDPVVGDMQRFSQSYTVTVDPPPATCSYSGPGAWGGASSCFDPGKTFSNIPVGNSVYFYNADSRFTSTSYKRFTCGVGGVWNDPSDESCVPVTPPPPPPPPSVVNGSCGSANNGALSTELISALPPSQLCSAGTWSGWGGTDSFYVGDSINGSGNHVYGVGDYRSGWYWRCNGSGGGSYAGCMGYTASNCGTANGGTYASVPTDPPAMRTTLCQNGTPSAVTTNATTYTWSCNNSPAASASCSANRLASISANITALGPVTLEDGSLWTKFISFVTGRGNVANASGPNAYISLGQKARINWNSGGSPSVCTIRKVGDPGIIGSSLSGTQELTGLPVGPHTYSIRCSKAGLPDAFDSVQVIVSGPSIPGTPGGSGGGEGGITANPQSCSQINVSWTPVTGATTYTLRDGSTVIAASTGGTSFAHTGLSASSNHNYNLRAENSAGNSAYSSSVSASTPACGGPTLTFGASPTSITSGSPSTLMWEPVGTASCWASGGWSGWKAFSGSNSFVVNPIVTTTYSLECWNGAGVSTGMQSATVNVGAGQPNCPATTISNCNLGNTPHTGTSGSCTAGYTGSCSYTCNAGGTWGGPSTNTCTPAVAGPDLTSSGLTVPASVAVGSPLNFSATVRNVGSVSTGIGFSDNFSYSWTSNSGPWTNRPNIPKAALASGASSVDNDSYTPASAGTIWIQHCVDSANVIAEGAGETPNCTVANGGVGTTVTGGGSPSLIISGCTIAQGSSKCVTKPSSVTNGVSGMFYGVQNLTTGVANTNLYFAPSWTYNPGSGVGTAVELTYGLNTLELWRTPGAWIAPKIQTVTASASCNTGGGDVWSVPLGRCVAGGPVQCADGIDNGDPEDILVDMADPGCSSAGDTDETDTSTPPVVTINTKTNSTVIVNPGDTVTIGWDTNNGDETSCTLTTSTNPDNIGNTVIFLPSGGNPEQGSLVSNPILVKTKFTVTCAGVTDTTTVEPISGPIET